MNEDTRDNSSVAKGMSLRRIVGLVLLSVFVASWFIWGPLGLVFYVGGLFNSLWPFVLLPLLFLLILLAVLFGFVRAVRTAVCWRKLSDRDRRFSILFVVATTALAVSSGLGFAGVTPAPFDMFVRGFARYAHRRVDVMAIQTWLATLDPNQYTDAYVGSGRMPLPVTQCPPAIARLDPNPDRHGTQVGRDDMGKLRVRLMWGGPLIGHWGIEVGDKATQPSPDSDPLGYRPLAPGAWVWSDSQ